ncbi:Crp/Fnr family transcriptional regulator [bacterium]|nr:Crp/Fnr family transcriptional regulator [bacterium]
MNDAKGPKTIPLTVNISCFTCQGRARSEWCNLSDEDLAILDRHKMANTYKAGQIIFYQGNPCLGIYCVESGTIAIRKSDHQGNSALVRMAHGGQTLGYRAYFSGGPYTASAEALDSAHVCFIEKEGVSKLLARNPNLGLQFLSRMAEDLREAEDARLQFTVLSVRARIAHLLLTLKERYGSADDDGNIVIELPMGRRDIADMVGTRPETVARNIQSLHRDGVAFFHGREVIVPDLDALLDEIELAESA